MPQTKEATRPEIDPATLASILHEFRDGRDPWVTYELAHACLVALGRPLSPQATRDLVVDARILGGRSVAKLKEFVESADAYIKRRVARPNMKAAAAAKARAAKTEAA